MTDSEEKEEGKEEDGGEGCKGSWIDGHICVGAVGHSEKSGVQLPHIFYLGLAMRLPGTHGIWIVNIAKIKRSRSYLGIARRWLIAPIPVRGII